MRFVSREAYLIGQVHSNPMVDGKIGGRLLSIFRDDCASLVLSDHESEAMKGGFCVNQWLKREGYLRLKKRPTSVIDFDKVEVNRSRTKAWGLGGHYARIFFNVKRREQEGTPKPGEVESENRELVERVMRIEDDEGRKMEDRVLEPTLVYAEARRDNSNLTAYFENLDWRSAGTVGHESLYLSENDTGPDNSVHSMEGVLLMPELGANLRSEEINGGRA
jgi:predicted AlkP superfamily phosphohydrolase/phosphomutase